MTNCLPNLSLEKLRDKLVQIQLVFPEDIISKFFEEIQFLITTGIIYNIIGYQNATKHGKSEHQIKFTDSNVLIKVQGRMKTVLSIMQEFEWDSIESMLKIKNHEPPQRWNYISEEGFVPEDRFLRHEELSAEEIEQQFKLIPAFKLSSDEMRRLYNHVSPNDDQSCILQFSTNPRNIKDHGLKQGWSTQFPIHIGIRIINDAGEVYSTGFGSTLEEDKTCATIHQFFASINGQPTMLDYEEMRVHEGRVVTSIPISSEGANKVLNTLNHYRKSTIRFNPIRQNCVALIEDLLEIIEKPLDTKIQISRSIYRCVFGAKNSLNRPFSKMSLLSMLFTGFLDFWILVGFCLFGGNNGSKLRDRREPLDGREGLPQFRSINPLFWGFSRNLEECIILLLFFNGNYNRNQHVFSHIPANQIQEFFPRIMMKI